MKKLKYLICLALLWTVWGCSEEKFTPDQYLHGLGGEDYTPNEIDEWILKNFTIPYNMEVKYRWDQSELDLNKTLVPVKEDVVIPVMQIVKHVWIEPYEVLAGEDFIRLYSPKKYVLVGSPMYNSDGTIDCRTG